MIILIAEVDIHEIDPKSSLEEILSTVLKTSEYKYRISPVRHLNEALKKLLPKYAEKFIWKIAETRAYPIMALGKSAREEIFDEIKAPIDEIDFSYFICDKLDKLTNEKDEYFKVEVDDRNGPVYANYHETFLVRGERRVIFIKFGNVD